MSNPVLTDVSTRNKRVVVIHWGDWLGALGDIGIFIPIYLTLVALNGLPPVRPLILVGIAYIITSLFFRVPMPVQPLKAVAAIAIAEGLGMNAIYAASVWLGIILLLLAATKTVDRISNYFTLPIVKGIQFGVGLLLFHAAYKLLEPHPHSSILPATQNGNWPVFISALWILVLPQLPLTLGNAVFALCDLSGNYFGERARRVTARNVAASIGLTDVTMGLLGGLPICHGSGGLTAHYRFGARTKRATIITGFFYIFLAIVFGSHVSQILKGIPVWIFSIMLAYAGIWHALLLKGTRNKFEFLIAFLMGIIGLLTENLAYSLAFGLIADQLRQLTFQDRLHHARNGFPEN